jgi:flavin reductase (DIM6/NTAB) family NADH-FMN oxidoreductase RutF
MVNHLKPRVSVDLSRSYKLMTHGPVTLLSTSFQDKKNVMAVAWSMPLDFSPPKVAVVIDANTLTRELVDKTGEFALQVPSKKLALLTKEVGHISGKEIDKFEAFNIKTFSAEKIKAPLLEDCIAWLECRVIQDARQTYDLFIAEVIAAQADATQFIDGRWQFSQDHEQRSIHYMAGGEFYVTGDSFEV